MADKNLFKYQLSFPSYRDRATVTIPATTEEEARAMIPSMYEKARAIHPYISPEFREEFLGLEMEMLPADITKAVDDGTVTFTIPQYYDEVMLAMTRKDEEGNDIPAFDLSTPITVVLSVE